MNSETCHETKVRKEDRVVSPHTAPPSTGCAGGRDRHGATAVVATGEQGGSLTVEFALILLTAIALFALVGEFLRVSLVDQILRTATKSAARRVAALGSTTGSNCNDAVTGAFQDDRNARWLLDRDDDGALTVNVTAASADLWPDVAASTSDVEVVISWDDDPDGGVDWSDGAAGDCGGRGSWLRLRAQVAVLPWYGLFRPLAPNGLIVRHESWARNTRSS